MCFWECANEKLWHNASVWLFSVLFSFCQFKAWHPVLKLSISYWEKNLSPLCVAEGAVLAHPPPFYLWLVSFLTGICLSNAFQRCHTLFPIIVLYRMAHWLCWTFCIGKIPFAMDIYLVFHRVTAWQQRSANKYLLSHLSFASGHLVLMLSRVVQHSL